MLRRRRQFYGLLDRRKEGKTPPKAFLRLDEVVLSSRLTKLCLHSPNVFCELFTRWIRKINPTELHGPMVPSGVYCVAADDSTKGLE